MKSLTVYASIMTTNPKSNDAYKNAHIIRQRKGQFWVNLALCYQHNVIFCGLRNKDIKLLGHAELGYVCFLSH